MQGAFFGENADLSVSAECTCVCEKGTKRQFCLLPVHPTGDSGDPAYRLQHCALGLFAALPKAYLPASQQNSKQQFHLGLTRLIFPAGSMAQSRGDFVRSTQPWSLFAMLETIFGPTLVSVSSILYKAILCPVTHTAYPTRPSRASSCVLHHAMPGAEPQRVGTRPNSHVGSQSKIVLCLLFI